MKNKIYRRLAFILSLSMVFSVCTPVMAAEGATEIVQESAEENTMDAIVEKNIWKGDVKENNRVYLDENGEKVIGLQEIEDKVYFFDEEGIVQTGWQKIDGVEYYFSPETGERYENRVEEIDGIQYSFNEGGEYKIVEEEVVLPEIAPEEDMETEIIPEDAVDVEQETEKSIEESVPKVKTGWITDGENKYFADQNGVLYRNQIITFGNTWYYMGADGSVQRGYIKAANGSLYYGDSETGMLKKSSWVETEGKRYYANERAELYKNQIITFGNTWYYMGADGSVQRGYIKAANGSLYYGDSETGMLKKSSWVETEGKRYYANERAELYKNQIITFGNTWYYMGADGSVQRGYIKAANGSLYYGDSETGMLKKSSWVETEGKRYYANERAELYKNQIITFGNTWYCMGQDGSVQKGIVEINGKLYNVDETSGKVIRKAQWVEKSGKRYYTNSDGVLYRNQVITFGSTWYCMGKDGSVQKGIVEVNGKLYYTDETTGQVIKKAQWIEQNGKRYFVTAEGKLYQNQIITFGNTWYYMGADGSVQKGIVSNKGTYYFADSESGIIRKQAGWIEYHGKKYYSQKTGVLYKNQFISFNETYYYCGSDAAIVTGKQVVGGIIYNFDSNGIMKKEGGWGEYNGNKYYKNPSTGFPYKNQWVTFGQTWYYANVNGFMVSGWQTIKGYRYYFYPSTKVMARNTTIDGIRIGPDGKASTAYTYAANILNQVGWNLYAAYNWSASLPYVNYANDPSPGSEAMALYGFRNGVGDCYVMAATFYYMAKLLGYNAHQIAGYVPLLGGGMGVHSWVEIDMNGTTYVFDPNFTNQTGRNGYQIYYGMSGTWRYSNYYRMN